MINQELCHNSICLDTKLCSLDLLCFLDAFSVDGTCSIWKFENIIKESISKGSLINNANSVLNVPDSQC